MDVRRPPLTLYHYTDTAGLKGIVESQLLWASDARFLNDASELAYAHDVFFKLLAERIAAASNPVVKEGFERWARRGQSFLDPRTPFVICFCEDDDLLSQWRGYGNQAGYAIGFSFPAQNWIPSFPEGWVQLLYEPHAQREVLEQALAKVAHALEQLQLQPEEYVSNPAIGHCLHEHNLGIAEAIVQLKHPGFAEEREWRFLAAPVRDPNVLPVRYRPTAFGLVPYMEIPLHANGRLPITSVRIGPTHHPATTKLGLDRWLRDRGYGGIEVRTSTIPLRFAR